MRAVVCQDETLEVREHPEPTPERGQVRLEVLRCGICGSDLHARTGCDELAALAEGLGYLRAPSSRDEVVFGHEFCGEVAEYGPGSRKTVKTGTPVVALPLLRNRAAGAVDPVGFSVHAPGAYAEQMVVQEAVMLPVPNGLPPDVAAMTEPMAVAHHAVRRGEVANTQTAVVIGCGPVGLGVILMLKAQGVRQVVASDLSPGRRALAARCGADVVVDPRDVSPFDFAPTKGHIRDAPEVLELGMGALEKLTRVPRWWHIYRAAEKLGLASPKHPVVFECVGVPGMIDRLVADAPLFSRVVVVGVCLTPDQFTPAMAVNKEIDLRFVLGYTPLEFRDTLHMLAEGKVDPRPLLTGTVGLDGVANAFTALGAVGGLDGSTEHAKILVDPKSAATAP